MKNASRAIRDTYFSALSGTVMYNAAAVPVYENLPINTLPDAFIEIGSIDEVNVQNDHKFMREVIVTVEVVTTQYQYVQRDVVDDISQAMTQIILSTIGGSLDNSNFQIGHIQLESTRYLDENSGNRYVTRKIHQFSQILIQK